MASIGSLPFNVEAKTETSVLLQSRNYRRRLSYFLAKSSEASSVHDSINGISKTVIHSRKLCCEQSLFEQSVWAKPLRAMSTNNSSSEMGDESEDSLDATIERSKKVLQVQRKLLQQVSSKKDLIQKITERKKLVTSIKNSVIETWEDEDSHEPGNRDSSITSSENLVDLWNGGIISSGSVDLNVEEETGNSINYSGNKKEEEITMDVIKPLSSSDSSNELENTNSRKKLSDFTEADSLEITDVKAPPLAGANVMNVIIVAAECAPWSKTGGLADVVGSLPKALARRGHRVMVVTPRYGNYTDLQCISVRKRYMVGGQDVEVGFYHVYKDGVDFVFIDCDMFHHKEQNIYGGDRLDILKRMVLFCKAAVEVPWHVPCGGVCYGDGNLVFIANDWHTALLPVYLKAYYRDNGLMMYTRSILVIHNIAHQGRGPMDDFFVVDLPDHHMDLFRLKDPVGGEHFNIFAAGLKTADRVVTVSHGYAWEIKTAEGGWGLHEIMNGIDWKLKGIVNGIDPVEWNPEVDIHLMSDGYVNYSLETLNIGKPQCKAALQKELGLPIREDVPLIGFIGRLDQQKGIDLIAEAIPWMTDQNVQLVMLGTGRQDLEELLRRFENEHRDKVRGWVGFSVKTAHRITAGADILLMPSRFEPCGLNQLYAMKYGTVPVVHGVGGLRDTVQPFDPVTETGLGWTFGSAETGQLIHALGNCLLTYREYKKSWEGLQRRGMEQNLSWDHAAEKYEQVLVAAKFQW